MQGSNHLHKRSTRQTREKRKARAKKKGEYKTLGHIERHAKRRAERGYANEERVASILAKAVEQSRYQTWRQTEHNDADDRRGVDFFVTRRSESGGVVERGFGVTISPKSWNDAKSTHPQVLTILVTPEMKDETLLSKVDALFV
ncbi:MAG: hypothetical protein HY457_01545 [Parcubacteria group bacterium]|nr:hypothetical protein [Parcubacteria group bacterium]